MISPNGRFRLDKASMFGSTLFLAASLVLGLPQQAAAQANEETHAHEHGHEDHDATETIVVTASPLDHDRDELSIPIDVVLRDDLLDRLGSTLGESIRHIPGITTSGFTAGASRPVIRGQDSFRTEVLEDGLRTQDVSRESADHAVPVNPLAAQRVEIVRGPATLRYGGNASAGVANVITNRIPDRIPTDTVKGEVFAGFGLNANERDLAAIIGGGKGNFAFNVDASLRQANDYSIADTNASPAGIQSGTGIEAWNGSLGLAYVGDWGRVGGSFSRTESVYGIPEGDEPVDIDLTTNRYRIEADLNTPLPLVREVRLRSVFSDYEHDEIADGEVGQTYENDEFESRLEILHDPVAGFTGAIGISGQYRDFVASEEAAEFLAPSETGGFGFYFIEEATLLENLTLETGFRVEYVRIEGTDVNDIDQDLEFVPLSGALGFVYTPTDYLTIGINGSASQRAPSQVELFARGPHEATGTFEIGNSNLDEETSFTGDLRVELKNDRGRIEWSFFGTRYENYIFANLSGVTVEEDGTVVPDGTGELDQLFYSDRDAVFWGTEISASYDVFQEDWGTLGLDGQFDFVRARFDSGGVAGDRDLPRITPIRWGANVYFQREALDFRFGFLRTETQDDSGAFESSTDGFTHINASLRYQLNFLDTVPLDLNITAQNLADVRGRNHVSFNATEVTLPGRIIRFGVRARF